ncbi:MAG: nucleotidyl transferase AbiEii/AbiGii toxin family protein, partial [Candidatus Margulisiibacteriota bacterium]
SSLFAGKLHAILCRKYEKGRDLYDLVWFIANKIKPNYDLLDQAFYQTEDKRISFDKHVLIKKLSDKLSGLNVTVLRSDVSPFLKDKTELRFIEKDALQTIINNIL